MPYRSVLGYPGFRNLWLSTGISAVGNRLFDIAFIWLVFEFTTDPTLFALALAIVALPEVLSTLVAGVVADRFDRSHTIAASQLSRAALVSLLPLVATESLAAVLGLGVLVGVAGSFAGPARGAIVPNLVPDDELDEGNAVIQLLVVTSRLLYVVSGVLVELYGAVTVLSISAVPMVLGAVVLLFIPENLSVPSVEEETADGPIEQLLGDYRDVAGLFRSNEVLGSVLLLQVGQLFIVAPIGSILLPYFTATQFGGDSVTYGVLYGSFFAGMFFSAGWFGTVMDDWDVPHGTLVVGGTTISGLFLAAMAVAPRVLPLPFVGAVVLHALAGAGVFYASVAVQTLLQMIPSDDDRGKVFSVLSIVSLVVAPASFVAAGPLVSALGVVPVLFGIGVASMTLGLLMALSPLYGAEVDDDATLSGTADESPVPSF